MRTQMLPTIFFGLVLTFHSVATAQSGKSQPSKSKPSGSSAEKLVFGAPPMQSKVYEGQLESDHDLFFREGVFPDQEGRGQIAREVLAESEPEAIRQFRKTIALPSLMALGFVPLEDKDILSIQKGYRGMGGINGIAQGAVLFRAKDAESLARATGKIALVGNRSQGRLNALPAQVFVALRPGQFYFQNGVARFMVHISIHLYGVKYHEEEKGGEIGIFEPKEISSLGFLDEIRKSLQEQREKTQDSLEQANRGTKPTVDANQELKTLPIYRAAPSPKSSNVKPEARGLLVAVSRYKGGTVTIIDNRAMFNVEVKFVPPAIPAWDSVTGEVEPIMPDGVKLLGAHFYKAIPGQSAAMTAFEFELPKPGRYEIVLRSKDNPNKSDLIAFDYDPK